MLAGPLILPPRHLRRRCLAPSCRCCPAVPPSSTTKVKRSRACAAPGRKRRLQRDDRKGFIAALLGPQPIKAWHSVLNQGVNGLCLLLVAGTPAIGRTRSIDVHAAAADAARQDGVLPGAQGEDPSTHLFRVLTMAAGTGGSTGYEVWKWMGVASVSNPGLIPVMRDPTTWRLVDPAKAAWTRRASSRRCVAPTTTTTRSDSRATEASPCSSAHGCWRSSGRAVCVSGSWWK